MINALMTLHDRLSELAQDAPSIIYRIPALWANPANPDPERVMEVEPFAFYRDMVELITSQEDQTPQMTSSQGEWTARAVVYNMFTRLTTAWDHDGDGRIKLEGLEGGWRETGSFLKSIAMLPYLRYLGVNTVHLLPVTAIGFDGNKGSLGSPYAIRNPYKLDERLGEPALGLEVDLQCAAFVEAAHRLGMRVMFEFVFRTASKDSDWIPDHPNWFYWIREDIPDRESGEGYGSPHFTEEELQVINLRVKRNDTGSLPPPGMGYRQMFTDPPAEVRYEDHRYVGMLEDGSRVRIPGAFADWPPNDVQPPWNDVTYLKMYDDPSFNYIAYNTIRIYDARLARVDNENRGLWNTIINIIPHYQKHFNVDGVMVDMGHALPRRLKQSIVERARRINPDFAFWEENFAISSKSRQEGYNLSVGYLWTDEHIPEKLRAFCEMLDSHDVPVPFFATPETHNTPRAASRPGGMAFSRMTFVVNSFLPGVLFIHQGYELGETYPVNTGLGFSAEDIAGLPSQALPLFSESALCWDNSAEMTALIHIVSEIRSRWEPVVTNPSGKTLEVLESENPLVLAYMRITPEGDRAIAVVANMDCHNRIESRVLLDVFEEEVTDLLSGETLSLSDGWAKVGLDPGQSRLVELRFPTGEESEMAVEEFTP